MPRFIALLRGVDVGKAKSGKAVTTRNWATTQKLHALANANAA